jgi:acyl-CoA reductase-like NAD-dependent aldehyde dehydrogenase
MSISASDVSVPIRHANRFFIGGEWVVPSSDSTITVIDSHTEQAYLTVAEAQAADIDRAVTAAREAFDYGPWARLSHAERAAYLRAIGAEIKRRSGDIVQMWPRESGVTVGFAATGGPGAQHIFDYYAGLADTFEWERPVKSPRGFGLVVKEPVGVVGAIVPWNTPMALISMKVAPALIAGCTVVLKTSPEAPGEGYLISEAAEAVVTRSRHDAMVEALASSFSKVTVGDPYDPQVQMGPLAAERQRTRVEGYIAKGIAGGATLAAGGGRPKGLDRGWYVEPTVFGNVDNTSVIAQEEIFGPVLSVIPADDEADAVRIANETIYGLHGAVFTNDNDRAREVAGQMRTGNIGHNGFKTDFQLGFGGFKQSGIGREGGELGLMLFLESKAILLDGPTSRYAGADL